MTCRRGHKKATMRSCLKTWSSAARLPLCGRWATPDLCQHRLLLRICPPERSRPPQLRSSMLDPRRTVEPDKGEGTDIESTSDDTRKANGLVRQGIVPGGDRCDRRIVAAKGVCGSDVHHSVVLDGEHPAHRRSGCGREDHRLQAG